MTTETACCIAGAGPAGAMLALLLARRGVAVTLLEEHHDFDRDFRGDTIHPSVLENLREIGLADALMRLPHGEMPRMVAQTSSGPVTVFDFRRLKTRYPFIMMLPQADFLEFVTKQAQQYPSFRLMMGARLEGLIEEDGQVRGVRYRTGEAAEELRAQLTVGADGRFSAVRRLGRFQARATSPDIDVLWFRLPKRPGDSEQLVGGRFGRGHMIVILSRVDEWQAGYIIPKGGYQRLRGQGIEELRRVVSDLVPEFADRTELLTDWQQIPLLSVASDCVRRWYRPGLLVIGDAAHTMSPVGGVGINYAIRDAVVASNRLARPLLAGSVSTRDLASVQRACEWPVRVIQTMQAFLQRQVFSNVIAPGAPGRPPAALRILASTPLLRDIPARLIAYGIRPAHIERRAR